MTNARRQENSTNLGYQVRGCARRGTPSQCARTDPRIVKGIHFNKVHLCHDHQLNAPYFILMGERVNPPQ